MSIEIPPGLTELLQGYTVEVLRHRPPDLLDFAAEYFSRLRDTRDEQLREGAAARGKGVNFDGEPMQTESNGEEERREAAAAAASAAAEDSDSDFEHVRLSVQISVVILLETFRDVFEKLGRGYSKCNSWNRAVFE
ncbi:cAMP-dependent protein kinase type II-alpha regulatory subunit [Varanus komodoensis]|nr:cAMP-dependent protein kinase type II-alpha regulatory subunit [Varanus komodoensis]